MKSLAKNYFLNLTYQVLTVILPLVTAPYLARVLGADRIGEYSFAQSIVSYFTLFSIMGTTLYGQRAIASCHARGESKKQVFWELVAIRGINVALALGIYFATVFRFSDNHLLYAVAAIEILAVAFDISWFYQGIEQFQNITLCNGLSKLLGAAGIFLFVKTRDDLAVYVLFLCGAMLVGNLAQWVFVWPYLKGENLCNLRISQHLRPSIRLFVSQFAIQAYTVLDKTMIGLITKSDYENGYYDQAQHLIRALVTLVTSIGTVMASRITILLHSGSKEWKDQVEDLILFSFRLVFALSLPIAVGVIIVMPRFVPIYYGPNYEPVIQLIQLLAAIVPVIGCSNIVGMQLFVPSGRENLLTKSVAIGAMVNIVLNSVFISSWGALGAALASVIAEMTVTGVQIFYARKDIHIGRIFKLLARYLVLSAIIGCVGIWVSAHVGMGIMGMFAIILSCVLVYVVLLLGLKDPVLRLFKM